MRKINWIILASAGIGTEYGVGTFIKQLSTGLAKKKEIVVYILKIGFEGYRTFELEKEGGITILYVPLTERAKETDTNKNHEKIARSIVRVASQYISPADINVVHMNYVFQYFTAKEFKQKLEGIILFTQHVFTHDETYSSNYFDTEFEPYMFVDQIITITHCQKPYLTAKGVSEDKVQVIYSGIDPVQFNLENHINIREKYGLTQSEHLILFSGRIDQIKGLDYLASAFDRLLKQIADCRLVITGNGDFESLIKATCRFSSRISFLGFIPFDDLVLLYHAATIGVIPSLEEHCNYVALEMLFCGLPVVASKLGGLKEIFIHNENAFLVEMLPDQTNSYKIAPDVMQLTGFMYELLRNEPLRQRFSRHAVARANATFTQDIMVDRYLKLTNELICHDPVERR